MRHAREKFFCVDVSDKSYDQINIIIEKFLENEFDLRFVTETKLYFCKVIVTEEQFVCKACSSFIYPNVCGKNMLISLGPNTVACKEFEHVLQFKKE